ncbi:MAG: DUF1559 domain-containing protein [Planctomycetales bacterium]|nr:DUF1559 domain-containing protein [Planctomycetales bacterium]
MAFGLTQPPAVSVSREAARRTQCKNQLKQIGFIFKTWHDQSGRFPDSNMAKPGQPAVSWRVALLPEFDQSELHRRYDDSLVWNNAKNLEVGKRRFDGVICPSGRNLQDSYGRWFASYFLVGGPMTAFPSGAGLSIGEITDGISNTLLVTEAAGQRIVWTEPRDLDVTRDPLGVNLTGTSPTHSPGILSSYHRGGAQAVLADGSVRFLNEHIAPAVLKAMTTATGGETVPEW